MPAVNTVSYLFEYRNEINVSETGTTRGQLGRHFKQERTAIS